MTYARNTGLNVANQYGTRETGGAVGPQHGFGYNWILKFDITPAVIADIAAGNWVPPFVIPRGANFNLARIRVDEAFTLTGTTPALSFGDATAIGTNFVSISQTELQAIGMKELASTGNGTWSFTSATGTTAATKTTVALTGTTPAVTGTAGKATLILEYSYNTKI